MKIILFLVCMSLAWASIIDIFDYFDASKAAPGNVNVEVLNEPDGRFSIEVEFHKPRIRMFAYWMNTVEVLTELSLQSFLGSMGRRSWMLRGYPDVGIMVLPQYPLLSIQRRFVIWGLSYGAAILGGMKRWQAADLHLRWNGVKVGTIVVMEVVSSGCPATRPYLNLTTNLVRQLDGLVSNSSGIVINCSSALDSGIDHFWDIRETVTGDTLDLFKSFLLIMTVIVGLAPLEAAQRLGDYTSPVDFTEISMRFFANPRTESPFFETQWLIHAVGAIPDLMIRRGGFQEAVFVVVVDQVEIAEGLVEKKSSTLLTPLANSNGSVI